MKRLTALILTLLLVLTGLTPALAAASIISGASPFTAIDISANGRLEGPVSFTIPGTLFSDFNDIDINLLSVTATTTPTGALTQGALMLADDGSDAIWGNLTLGARTNADQPLSGTIVVNYNGVASQAYTIPSGVTLAKADGTINSLKGGTIGAPAGFVTGGTAGGTSGSPVSFTVDLKNAGLYNVQGSVAPSAAQLAAAGVSITAADNGFTFNLVGNGVYTISNDNPGNISSFALTIATTTPVGTMTVNVPVSITDSPPATTTGAVFNTNAPLSFTPSLTALGNGKYAMSQTTSLVITIPKTQFTITGATDIASLVAYLNANNSISSSSAINYSASPFSRSGENVVFTATISAGTYTGLTVSLNVGGVIRTATLPTPLTVYSANTFLGIRTGTISAPSTSSMTVGSTLYYEITSSNTYWTGSAPANFASTLTAGVNVNGLSSSLFSYAFVYENGKTYLKLTAKAAGSVSGSFTITDKTTAPTSQTLTLNLPTVSITTTVSTSGNKITGIDSGSSLENSYKVNGSTTSEALDDLTLNPGDIVTLEFDSNFFTWQNGKPNPVASLTSSMLSSGKIEMRTASVSGPVDYTKIVHQSGKSYIEIKIKKDVNSTKDVKFGVNVYFYVNGTRHTASGAQIKGVVTQDAYEVYNGDDVDMTDNPVIEAAETVRNGSFYIGLDMTIHASLTKGRTYYASANNDLTTQDERIFNTYADVVEVLHIDQTNFPSGSTVSFDTYDRLYVYDGDGNYLGTTSDKVPLKSTYYLASKRITFGSAVIETPSSSASSASSSSSSSSSSGNWSGSSAGSYNPNTGR